jgi:hypothetical protein
MTFENVSCQKRDRCNLAQETKSSQNSVLKGDAYSKILWALCSKILGALHSKVR